MIKIEYTPFDKEPLTPEERLAKAIVMDWFSTIKELLLKEKLTKAEKRLLEEELNWPYTDNASFWVEEVLDGSIEALRLISEDIRRIRKGQKPKYFPILLEILKKREVTEDETRTIVKKAVK